MAKFLRLKKLREGAGLSQNKLASRAGVSRDFVSKAEKGEDCTASKLHLILHALNNAFYTSSGKPLDAESLIID